MQEFPRLVVAVSCNDLETGLIFLSFSLPCLFAIGRFPSSSHSLGVSLDGYYGERSSSWCSHDMGFIAFFFSHFWQSIDEQGAWSWQRGAVLGFFTVNFWEIPTRETFPHAPRTLKLAWCDVAK